MEVNKRMMGRCIPLHALGVICFLQVTFALGPPAITHEIERWQHAKFGETVRLPCPVRGDPSPFYQWYKDEEAINAGWDRHRVMSTALKIKDVTEEDSGNYECKATNGFGSALIQYYLYVSPNNSDEVVTPPPDFKGKYYPSDRVPFFVRMDQMSTDPIHKPLGANIRLKCKAEGEPKPDISWLKDGKRLVPDSEFNRHPHWTLRLHDVGLQDSGKYTCKVTNRAGAISFNYTIIIEDKVEAPKTDTPNSNLSVPSGDMAVFRCEVNSLVEPRIKWLKLVESPPGHHGRKTNSTITLQGKDYILLNKTSEVLEQRDGSWLNKLVLYKVTERDAGSYICLAANSMGFSYKEAYLTVYPDPGHRPANSPYDDELMGLGSNPSLPLIIAVPAAVIIVIVIISIYVVHRRRADSKNKSKPRSPSARGPVPPPCGSQTSSGPTPDKVYIDPYQAYHQQPHHLHPMLPPQHQHHHNMVPQHHMNITPNTALMAGVHGQHPGGAPMSRDRLMKNYSDVHSDISLGPKVPLSPQSHQMGGGYPPHHHMAPYGC